MTPSKLLKVEHNILPKIELVQLKFDSKILPMVENRLKPVTDAKHSEFANRLKKLMEVEGSPITSVNELKDAIGVTYEMARRYTLGTAKPREEKLKELASIFNVEIGFLDHGQSFDNNVDLTQKIHKQSREVPVISWIAAGAWTSVDGIPKDIEVIRHIPPNAKVGKNGYGLVVVGESMLPDFQPGDYIYVNPDFQTSDLKTGNKVIVSCDGDIEATFKKLIVETNNMYLESLNPKWHEKIMELKDGCKLVGKVVGLYRDVD